MSGMSRVAATLALVLVAWTARGQQATPHIGYVYPAGGQQGTTFQVIVGGQYLDAVTNVFVSGSGVQTSIVDFSKPMPPGEFNRLRDRFRELQQKRQAAFRERRNLGRDTPRNSTNSWTAADEKALTDIRERVLKNPPNRQATPAIAENVTVRVRLAAEAETGEREVRLGSLVGISNPLKFWIGQLPEYSEPPAKTPNPEVDRFLDRLGKPPVQIPARSELSIRLPAAVNGQIGPGGAHRYRFHALKGERVVAIVRARDLIPYLADAVPGWFQAALTLYDTGGHEVAYVDDYRFHPDPVLECEIPKQAEYILEIKDALFRGREDFVYRITIGDLPFVTSIFPLGGKAGDVTRVELKGWNLKTSALSQTNSAPGIVSLVGIPHEGVANNVPFAVETLPECIEKESNNRIEMAEPITLPIIVNGRINEPGDWDVFRFQGRAGEQIVAEVYARRLGSPLDSLVKLTDAKGGPVAMNDDFEDKGCGLDTHHADSYIRAVLPADGAYCVHIGDTQHKGSLDHAYRLRISAPRPNFELRVVPSSLSMRCGAAVPLTVYALRKDGFTNEIFLDLNEAPPGFHLSGGRVPAAQDQVRVTLSAPRFPLDAPAHFTLQGRATIAAKEVLRPAVPADDMMQAFAYHHLVPAKEFTALVFSRGMMNAWPRLLSSTPVRIPAGGTAQIEVSFPAGRFAENLQFELSDPPEGITLKNVSTDRGVAQLVFQHAGARKTREGNLIVDAFMIRPAAQGRPALRANRTRFLLGTLPAVPFEVVER